MKSVVRVTDIRFIFGSELRIKFPSPSYIIREKSKVTFVLELNMSMKNALKIEYK